MKHGIALLAGILFGLGLAIAGMTMPHKVIGFLDFFGNWDPTLIFVMLGAIAVHFFAYRIIKRKTSPLLDDTFHVPSNRQIDRPLIIGSALFGIGWALAGYCPGPGLVALITLDLKAFIFVGSMAMGIALQSLIAKRNTKENSYADA